MRIFRVVMMLAVMSAIAFPGVAAAMQADLGRSTVCMAATPVNADITTNVIASAVTLEESAITHRAKPAEVGDRPADGTPIMFYAETRFYVINGHRISSPLLSIASVQYST